MRLKLTLKSKDTKQQKRKDDVVTSRTFKYKCSTYEDITITVKGELVAKDAGFPTNKIGDTVMIETGIMNSQGKLEDISHSDKVLEENLENIQQE